MVMRAGCVRVVCGKQQNVKVLPRRRKCICAQLSGISAMHASAGAKCSLEVEYSLLLLLRAVGRQPTAWLKGLGTK